MEYLWCRVSHVLVVEGVEIVWDELGQGCCLERDDRIMDAPQIFCDRSAGKGDGFCGLATSVDNCVQWCSLI